MKKLLKGFLVLSLFAMNAKADTNKTFAQPRPHGVNLAMEYTTWNELLQTKDEDRFGANFQLVPFYQDSADNDSLGKYFGFNNNNQFTLKYGAEANSCCELDYRWITRCYPAPEEDTSSATIKLNPKQEAYGVRIDYYQDLEKILKGLYLKVALPIVHVENDMRFEACGATGCLGEKVGSCGCEDTKIKQYFAGNYEIPKVDGVAGIEKLKYAKMCDDTDETGVADIDIVLGYKFLDKENYHASLNLGFTIPTGNDPDGEYVFEAIVGNLNHWALGFGLDFGARLWEDEDQDIKFTAAMNYRYLFESSEKRTMGIGCLPFGQYFLVGEIGKFIDEQTFKPAANLMTRDLDVTPGSQIDAILMFTYNNGGFTFDLGYNFFWKDSEDVDCKKDCCVTGEYGIADITMVLTDAYEFGIPADGIRGAKWLLKDCCSDKCGDSCGTSCCTTDCNTCELPADGTTLYMNPKAAATPSQDTHKIFGGIGYIFKEWEYPMMLNLSAHYEWADGHDGGVENWGIWGKIGVAF